VNEDRTITWGMQLRYTQPLAAEGARLGLIATGNTKAHPKIPNYNIVNIPRDPGNSAAFNLGAGLSTENGPATIAFEVVFEPARSHTWAFADSVTAVPGGGSIPVGGKTVDNQFRFRNWNAAVGGEHQGDRYGVQFGLRLRQINYTLEQHNFLQNVERRTRESWMEWSPSWAGNLRFPEFELRYTGRFTARGWPGMGFIVPDVIAHPGGTDFVIGPTGPVFLPDYRVTTHRLTLAVPFGR